MMNSYQPEGQIAERTQPAACSLAVMTFGISQFSKRSATLEPFYPYVSQVIKAARAAPGFASQQPSLGPLVHPRFYDSLKENAELEVSQVLFFWDNIEAVVAFSYSGIHKQVLSENRESSWFMHDKWPAYVAWWDRPENVTWAVGCAKLEQLKDRGPLASAFNFSHPFGVDGSTYTPDFKRLSTYKSRYLVRT